MAAYPTPRGNVAALANKGAFVMTMQGIPLLEVQARWGYSELIDSPASRHYTGLDHLVEKRSGGISFAELSEAEQYELAFGTARVRTTLFAFFTGAVSFDIVEIGRPKLATMFVPPNVWYPESDGRFVRFEEYMSTTSADADDPRNVSPKGSSYEFPPSPSHSDARSVILY